MRHNRFTIGAVHTNAHRRKGDVWYEPPNLREAIEFDSNFSENQGSHALCARVRMIIQSARAVRPGFFLFVVDYYIMLVL